MKSRFLNLDLTRVIGMVMVIVLHTAVNFTLRTDFFATKLWFLLEPVVAISKTAVLLFFMISGYLLTTKQRSIRENLNKTITKLVLPLSFFTAIDSIINFSRFDMVRNTWLDFFIQELNRLMNEKSSPLWFLIVLVFLYLLNPIWQKIFSHSDEGKLAKYITAMAFLFSLIMAIFEYPAHKNGIFFTGATYWLGYVCFYLYGGLVKANFVFVRKRLFNWGLLLSGLVLTMAGDFLAVSWQLNGNDFIWNTYTANYLSLPVMMTAIGLFNLLVTVDLKKIPSVVASFIEKFAQLSFGVYLIHGYFILLSRQVLGFKFDLVGLNVYLYNTIDVGSILILSMLTTWIWLKIPKLKSLVGG